MARTFIGNRGHYEIDDEGKIVFKSVNDSGKCTGEIRQFKSVKEIKNESDRNGVLHLLQLIKIHKTVGSDYLRAQT